MKKIVFVSFNKKHKNNEIFKVDSLINRDNSIEPYVFLKKYLNGKGYSTFTEDLLPIIKSDIIIMLRIDLCIILKSIIFRKRIIYIMFEPPVVERKHEKSRIKKFSNVFDMILTWDDDLVGTRNFYKFFYPMPKYCNNKTEVVSKKKLLTNISAYKSSNHPYELYSERERCIKYFEKKIPEQFDLYGYGWPKSIYKSYRGPIDVKNKILSQYKFSICFENMNNINGLVSEKIFDSMIAHCIPIYLGAKNILDYIPVECFIDASNFNSYDELGHYIESMKVDEYNRRLQAIDDFLEKGFQNHEPQNFASTIEKVIDLNHKNSIFKKFKGLFFLVAIKLLGRN